MILVSDTISNLSSSPSRSSFAVSLFCVLIYSIAVHARPANASVEALVCTTSISTLCSPIAFIVFLLAALLFLTAFFSFFVQVVGFVAGSGRLSHHRTTCFWVTKVSGISNLTLCIMCTFSALGLQ